MLRERVVNRHPLRHNRIMISREIHLPDQAATEELARRLGDLSRPGDAILLSGDLGAGKSTLARALLRHLANDPNLEVPSPTFSLVQSYATRRGTAHHFDLWRLGDSAELAELGWDEAMRDLILVEWPEKMGPERLRELTDAGALAIFLTSPGDDTRTAHLTGWPDRLESMP